MNSAGLLVLRILGEGRISTDEARQLLLAAGCRRAFARGVRSRDRSPAGSRGLLPVSLPGLWSGPRSELI
jgi:hypothetical protein